MGHAARWGLLYLVITALVCLPSIMAWTLDPFDIGRREFDITLGQTNWLQSGRVAHSLGFLVLGGIYIHLMRLRVVLPKWLMCSAVFIWTLSVPWLSPDVFFYFAKGWFDASLGLDPYMVRMVDVDVFRGEPAFQSVAPGIRSVLGNYGPLFHLVSKGIAILSAGDPKVGLFIFKLIVAGTLWATIQALKVLATEHSVRSSHLSQWILLNPLVLANFVGAAHNDVFVVLPMLWAVILQLRGRIVIAGLLLGVATSLKLSGVFVLPVLVLASFKAGYSFRSVAQSGVVTIFAFVAGLAFSLAPYSTSVGYLAGWAINDSEYFRSTIHIATEPLLRALWPHLPLGSLTIGKGIFLLVGGWRLLYLKVTLANRPSQFAIQGSLEMLLLGQLLAMQMMNEWYLLWPFVFCIVLADHAAQRFVFEMTLVYMTVVIWAIVGPWQETVVAQSLIASAYLISVGSYFRNVGRGVQAFHSAQGNPSH